MTPLHVAVKHEHPDLVEILLSHGARVNATNHKVSQVTHCCSSIALSR